MKVTNIIIENIEWGKPEIGASGQVCFGYRDTDDHTYTITLGGRVVRALIRAYEKRYEKSKVATP
jgi:hypothetical protein